MGNWGRTRRGGARRILIGAAALAVVATGLVTSPAQAAAGDDCGGADTPPAHHVNNNGTMCAGSLDEPAVSSTPEPWGYTTHRYEDAYTFSYTDGDSVRIESSLPACTVTEPSGSFIAEGNAPLAPLAVKARRTAAEDGTPAGPCPSQPTDYWLRVYVTPNDRPAVSPDYVQTTGQRGDTFTFRISGTDPDGNLSALGFRYGDSDNYEWKTQPLPSGSWSTEITKQFYNDRVLRFYARDSRGALSPASAPFLIDVGHDDCGLGRDAVVEAVTLPLHCSNWLEDASDIDSFTFTPSPGVRPKATVTTGYLQGYELRLTSPSGTMYSTSDQGDPDLYGTTEPGVWRVDVRGDGDSMGYLIDIVEVGPIGSPTLTVSAPAQAHQGDYYAFNMTGVDPNGQTLSYRVDWGNGSQSIWPIYGRAASGETVTGYRRFMYLTPAQWTATVTVTNSDGLTDTATFTVEVVPHDDCGLGNPDYDAPGGTSGLSVMPSPCDGTLGYYLPLWEEETLDAVDAFRSPVSCLAFQACKVKVTLITDPGLSATVSLTDGVTRQSSFCGFYGCTTSVSSLGPTLAGAPRIAVEISAGKGGYRLVVEKVPLTDGVV